MKISKKLRETRKKARAISPVLAILLMIVITVAASLVTYAWVMGYLSFTTAKAGRAMQVQSVAWDNDTQVLMVYVQNVGEDFVTLREDSSVYVDGILKTDVGIAGTTDGALPAGDTSPISINNVEIGLGQRVRVRIVDLSGTFTEIHTVPLTGTGGLGFVVTPVVTRVQEKIEGIALSGTGDGSSSFDSAPTEGNLLVVIAGHRQANPEDHHAPTIAGYTLHEVEWDYTDTFNSRRIVAIFTKVADPSESSTVAIDWNDDGLPHGFSAGFMILQEFTGATTYSYISSDGNGNGGLGGESTILNVPAAPLSDGGNDNILAIAGMAWRGSLSALSFTGLGDSIELLSGTSSTINAASAFSYNTGGTAVTQTTVSWTTDRLASGLLALFSCE